MINGETLNGIAVFRDLSISDRDNIAGLFQRTEYKANKLIVSHKDTYKHVYFVINGKVRVTFYSMTGKEISFRDQHAGDMFGELSAIDDQPRSAHVLSLTDSSIAKLSQEDFLAILRKYPVVADHVFKRLTRLVRNLSARVIEFSTLGVTNRIHAELLRLARDAGIEDDQAVISPAPKHVDIANRISTHREAVSRVFKELITQGVIAKQPNAIVIREVTTLHQMVDDVLNS